jgi:anti-anti-sigma factor
MFNWQLNKGELVLNGILDKKSGVELWNNRHKFLETTNDAINDSVIIRLSQLEQTDSAGLATLIALFKEARHKNILMKILGAPQQLLDIAKISGIESILPFE